MSPVGTGIALFGTTNGSYQVVLDANSTTFSPVDGNTLFFQQGLSQGEHTIKLISGTAPGTTQLLMFDNATIQTPVNNAWVSFHFLSVPFLIVKYNTGRSFYENALKMNATNTSEFDYTGFGWNETIDNNVPVPGQASQPFYITQDQGDTVSFAFRGQGIELHGDLNWGHGDYSVVCFNFRRIREKFLYVTTDTRQYYHHL